MINEWFDNVEILYFLVGIYFSQQIIASSLNFVLNGKATHEHKKYYNEDNWGGGLEYNFDEKNKWINFINGGVFKDIVVKTSTYLGGGTKHRFLLEKSKDGWHIDVGMTVFFMTRKNYKNNQPFFGALPYLSIGTNRFAINSTYIPAVTPKFEALWFFQATLKVANW